MRHHWGILLVILVILLGCGSGKTIEHVPDIEIEPNFRKVELDESLVSVGEKLEYSIRVKNVGNDLLRISSVKLNEQVVNKAAFSLEMIPGTLPVQLAPKGEGNAFGLPEEMIIKVLFERVGDGEKRAASLTIKSNTHDPNEEEITIEFTNKLPTPHIQAVPQTLDLGQVKEGETGEKLLYLLNSGAEVLLIYGIKFYQVPDMVGDEPVGPFRIQLLDKSYSAIETKKGVKFEEPLVIKSNQSIPVKVKYSPTIPDPVEATIHFSTNDPLYPDPEGYKVTLRANFWGPCISVNPPSLDFGGVVITNSSATKTEIRNCGDSPLEIYSIELGSGSSKDFSLDKSLIPGYQTMSKEKPLILQSGEMVILIVKYFPQEVKKDAQGKEIEDQGRVIIENNSFSKTVEIQLKGMAIGSDCPVADFLMYDGPTQLKDKDTVKVMTSVKFKNTSYDPNPLGGIAYYEWSVEQPPDAEFMFNPSNKFPDPTFALNVAGAYTFRLKVINKNGIPSCNIAEKTLIAKSGEGIHIELTWTTPNDPDQTDECPKCGTDLDVHFVHQYAAGQDLDKDGKLDGYFDCPKIFYDAFWYNPHPHWVENGNPATQDPNLDLDDTNGLGPENMRLNLPEDGITYKVGVHYWNDHGFGISYATLKIYIHGELKWKKEKVKMMNLDMWDAVYIKWTGNYAAISEILHKGTTKIIKNYIPSCLYNPN